MATHTEEESPMVQHRSLPFPGGDVVKVRKSREQLQDSASAWLAMARPQVGSVAYWAELGDRTAETLKSIETLKSYINHAERALRESEMAK